MKLKHAIACFERRKKWLEQEVQNRPDFHYSKQELGATKIALALLKEKMEDGTVRFRQGTFYRSSGSSA